MNVQVVDEFVYELRLKESNVEKRRKINSLALCYIQTSFYHADTSDCLVYFFLSPSLHRSPCMIRSGLVPVYNTIWLRSSVQYQSPSRTYYNT